MQSFKKFFSIALIIVATFSMVWVQDANGNWCMADQIDINTNLCPKN